jgi:hypothetical protein
MAAVFANFFEFFQGDLSIIIFIIVFLVLGNSLKVIKFKSNNNIINTSGEGLGFPSLTKRSPQAT